MMNDCEEMENMKGNNNRYRVAGKKTRLEKWLIVICTMLLLILVATVVFFVLYSNLFKAKREVKPETKSELNLDTICNNTMRLTEDFQVSAVRKEKRRPKVCNSQTCVEEAATIIRKIDFSVPPCKNFYRFACGNYIKDGIPNTLDYTRDVLSDMEKEVNRRIRRILESLNRSKRSENELKMKKFYRSCVDMRRNNLSTREIIENILRHLQLEEWPSVQLNAASMTLEEKLAIIMAHGGRNPLFHVEYEGMNTVMLQEPKTILREQFLLSEENDNQAMDEYRRLMMEVFTRAGYSSAAAENEVESVLEFEISIAEIARDHLEDAYSLLELSQLEAVLPKFNWLPLFRHFYHYLERVGYKAKDATVVLQSPGYLEELIQLLQDTNSKTVESYVMWSFLFQFLHIFDSSLAKHYHALNYFVNQNFKDLATTDWESCTLLTKSRFREALHHRYAKEVIKETVLKKVEEIDKDIKHAFDEFVQSDRGSLHYNSKSWKEISNISLGIPYKDVHASEKPHKIYPRMRMSDDFIANIFRMEKETILSLVITGSPQELPSSEDMLSIKPLYEDVTYELPLGVFQPPYITEETLSYSSYAALAFPIAVKLLRNIRDLQILNDIKSTENKNATSAEETNCFETEYSEFLEMTEINEKANTSLVLNEYLHSSIGIRLAFEAYKIYVNSSGIEEKLPGLDFETDQLFFINHAGLMCEAWTEEMEEKYLRNGHSPAEFRVNSALRNSKEFAKTFNCPAGSNMNPNLKCLI